MNINRLFQGDSGEARTLSSQLEQKLQQIRSLMRDSVVEQFAEVFADVDSPLDDLSQTVALPNGRCSQYQSI